jgi:hypothetical protein
MGTRSFPVFEANGTVGNDYDYSSNNHVVFSGVEEGSRVPGEKWAGAARKSTRAFMGAGHMIAATTTVHMQTTMVATERMSMAAVMAPRFCLWRVRVVDKARPVPAISSRL